MPSKSRQQQKLVFAKRGQYKTKAKTPKQWKWVWKKEWTKLEEENLLDKYLRKLYDEEGAMPGGAGGANAPMSTTSIGLKPSNYVGTMRPDKKRKKKKDELVNPKQKSLLPMQSKKVVP